MSTDAAHNSWWQIGEVVFVTPLLAAIVLQIIAPLSLTNSVFTLTLFVIGAMLCGTGIAFIVATRRVFAKYSQPTDPKLPTSFIVITDVFSISRNPMYLGAICLLLGIALVFKLAWLFVFLVPTVIACHFILIDPEERYLAAKFGTEYQSYTALVHRWLGRKLR